MSGLRLILLCLGLLLIAAIYFWGSAFGVGRRASRNKRVSQDRRRGAAAQLPGDEDIDYAGELANLDGLVKEGRSTEPAPGGAESVHARVEPSLPAAAPEHAAASPAPARELIVVLFVVAPEGHVFGGRHIAEAFTEVGMHFGDMNVYHHFGVGHMRPDRPVFSVANMFEPGTFDPQTMDAFATAGVALYTRLPQAVDGRVAFELMLNTAQRLAQRLAGRVLDEARRPLDVDGIDRLRRRVGDFEDGRLR